MGRKGVCFILAAAAIAVQATAASAASFQSAVEDVLKGQTSGPVSELDDAKRSELAACIVEVLAKAPEPKKEAVVQAKTFDEKQDRFGEIVMADNAKLKQQISLKCGDIATEK